MIRHRAENLSDTLYVCECMDTGLREEPMPESEIDLAGVPGFALCHSSAVTSSSLESRGAEVHILRIEHPVPDYVRRVEGSLRQQSDRPPALRSASLLDPQTNR